jgi:hypothetical protein
VHALHDDALPLLGRLLPQTAALHPLRAARIVPGRLLPEAAAVHPVSRAELLPGRLLPQTAAESLLAGRAAALPLPAAGMPGSEARSTGESCAVKARSGLPRRSSHPLGIRGDFF